MIKKDCSLTSFIKPAIYLTMGFVLLSFIMSIGNLDNSLLVAWSGDTVSEGKGWEIRGQIGDVMSGHFSALAFLAVALGIFLQSEANQQMKESIDNQEESLKQQSEALRIQSESLESQIEELKASRIESSKQTEEFAISNMNIKLDRYYKLLNEIVEKTDENTVSKYIQTNNNIKKMLTATKLSEAELLKVLKKSKVDAHGFCTINDEVKILISSFFENHSVRSHQESCINNIMQVLNHIYNDLEMLNLSYPHAYILFIKELEVRLYSNKIYREIYKDYEDAEKLCLAFRLFKKSQT